MVTVERVVPWRRDLISPADDLADVLAVFNERNEGRATDLIEAAYLRSLEAHEGQIRKSGEPYIQHPLAVALIVAEQGLDDVSIASALLHDAVEDTEMGLGDVEAEFGPEVAAIIDGCTKVDRLKFDSKEAQQAATMRKMLVAVAKDVRVLIIKLADRLHNMRTLAVLPEFKQHRTGRETLHIFAPLANRLGMQELKSQLEDLAFASLHPKWYAEIDHMVATRDPERDLYLHQIIGSVEGSLAEVGISADITGRPKHLWSIYEKMVVKGRGFEDIYDLIGIRVIVDDVTNCYAALGQMHAVFKPVQGRFKDYIAMPKFNLYQSLHTTVVAHQGKPVEIQLRTQEMHQRAEYGVAAHWSYKSGPDQGDLSWLKTMTEWQEEESDLHQFMADLKTDLGQEEVLVFTPDGEVVTLTVGATPVDFAYAIHTELGHATVGAKINGRLVSLDTRLTSGDTVEIFRSKSETAGPSQDWLKFVATQRAASKIRQWQSRERREDAIASGRDDLTTTLRREGLPIHEVMRSATLNQVAEEMNYTDPEAMFGAIGERHVSPKAVVSRIEKMLRRGDPDDEERVASTALAPTRQTPRKDRDGVGVHVEGLEDVWVRLSKCCTPVPPDDIMGFITRGRGVSVHRSDCTNAVSLGSEHNERVIDVEWDVAGTGSFVASIELRALDRPSLLSDVAQIMAEQDLNILSSTTRTGSDRMTVMKFELELGDGAQLESVMRRMRNIDSVYEARRAME